MVKSVNLQEYYLYNQKCKFLLKESEIRFAGFLDPMGNLIAGGFKEGIVPFMTNLKGGNYTLRLS
ncbi:MAG: hypothetical protein ACR2LL_11745 [Nitrosopumilus sp.]